MPRKTIHIYADDDLEKMRELRVELALAERDAAKPKAPARVGDDAGPDVVREKREALDKAIDAAADRAHAWVVQSIGYEAWRELLKAHPPRKVDGEDGKQVDHPDDEQFGVNTETFGKALLLFVDPEDEEHRTVVEMTDGELTALGKRLRRLSEGQFFEAWYTAYSLNVGGFADPKLASY